MLNLHFCLNIECPTGSWGKKCAFKCGKCFNSTCDVFDGRCSGGCIPGYTETSRCKHGKDFLNYSFDVDQTFFDMENSYIIFNCWFVPISTVL